MVIEKIKQILSKSHFEDKRTLYGILAAELLLMIFLPSCNKKQDSVEKPNIVFIFADQLRSHAMGCYGNNQLKTPNMDRLANEGVRFTNAISTAPVCGPFRGMLMTGNFPMQNGMVVTDHFLRNPTPYFAEVCKNEGYATGYIGKWHLDGYDRLGYIPPERRLGFDFWRTMECTHDYFHSKYYHQDEKTPRTWEGYDAIAQTEEACRFIAEQKNNSDPFLLFISWGPPHGPYIAPDEYFARFENKEIRMRDNVNDFETANTMWQTSDTEIPDRYDSWRIERIKTMKRKENNAQIEHNYKMYYAAVEALDDCLGRIYYELEHTGQLDNTIIVFTSDHGDNLGSHRQVGKQLPFEESISIPFLVRYPEKIKEATITDALLSPVDMMPTVFSLAGIPCHQVDGKDISGAAMGKDENKQDAVLIMKSIPLSTNWIVNGNGAWRGVRTKSYTYARNSHTKEPWLLFDNQKDPYQLNNLVVHPDYAELVSQLDKKTDELLKVANDPEDPEFYAKLIQKERVGLGVEEQPWELLVPDRVEPGSSFDVD